MTQYTLCKDPVANAKAKERLRAALCAYLDRMEREEAPREAQTEARATNEARAQEVAA